MKFRTKMVICMVWLLALAYGIGGSLLISSSFRASMEHEKTAARQSFQMLLNTLAVLDDYGEIRDTLHRLDSGNTEWSGVLVRSNDAVLYRSGNSSLPDEFPEEDVLTVQNRQILISSTASDARSSLRIHASYNISSIYERRDAQISIYRWTFLVMTVLCGLLSWMLCTWLTYPLRSLSKASRQLAEGKRSVRVKVVSRDEVGQLSAEFNRMADTLEETIAQMTQTMERQEEFMGSFAHELKTPMTSIIGYADLLRSQELSEPDRREAANYVFSEGKRLESLSLKLLDLLVLDKDDIPMQLCSPKTLIEAIAKEFRPIMKQQGITLRCSCKQGSWPLEPDLFKSLLYNLMDNARKAMDQGGQIMIQCDFQEEGLRIRVADNGRGMPEEALNRLTEAFYRVDKSRSRAQGGAGLGLSLCKRIADLHNGTIRFTSREGVGTCVTVLLKGGGNP